MSLRSCRGGWTWNPTIKFFFSKTHVLLEKRCIGLGQREQGMQGDSGFLKFPQAMQGKGSKWVTVAMERESGNWRDIWKDAWKQKGGP